MRHLEDYETILHRQEVGSWVADVPSIPGCYALMPTREEALAELCNVFPNDCREIFGKGNPSARQRHWNHLDGRAVTIPIPSGHEIGLPLFFKILRQLGVTSEEFQRLL